MSDATETPAAPPAPPAERTDAPRKASSYGMYLLTCPACGWHTAGRIKGPPPLACDKCGQSALNPNGTNASEWREDVACLCMSLSEWSSRGIQQEAEKHGLMVYQISKNRYVVLRAGAPCTVGWKSEDKPGKWGYMSLEAVHGPADWQSTAKYVIEKTEPLPAHLR